MSNIIDDLVYEILKSIQDKLARVERKIDDLKNENTASCSYLIGVQQDIHSINNILHHHDERLERIEKRLELSETVN